MDHLHEAATAVRAGDLAWTPDSRPPSEVYLGALAHALIALVERLDALTVTDDSGKAALRTFRTVEI
jgi:hypothetical protein